MSIEDIPKDLMENYEIHEWKHAITILKGDFPREWKDIVDVLTEFKLKKSWINIGGGRKSNVAAG
jgi:hypothetical protein